MPDAGRDISLPVPPAGRMSKRRKSAILKNSSEVTIDKDD